MDKLDCVPWSGLDCCKTNLLVFSIHKDIRSYIAGLLTCVWECKVVPVLSSYHCPVSLLCLV